MRAKGAVPLPVCCALLLSLWLGAAPAAAEEIHRWVDAQGREHFGNKRPAGAVAVESAAGGVVNQADSQRAESGTPSSGSEAIADRLNKLRRQNQYDPNTTAKPAEPKHTEAWCQKTYGKSCKELDEWREKAIAECLARKLSHCDDPKWIENQHPKTLDEIAKADKDKREHNASRESDEDSDDADGGDEADGAPDPAAPDAPPGEGPPPPADSEPGSDSEPDTDSDAGEDEDADADEDEDDSEDSDDDQEQGEDDDSDRDNQDRASDRAADGKRSIGDNARRQTAKPRPPARPRAAR